MDALTNIAKMSRFFGVPKLIARIVPPIGVSNTGVNAATPTNPYLRQIRMNFRFRSENFFRFLKNDLKTRLRMKSPKKVNANTAVIIPATVVRMVVTIFSPETYPPSGPKMNFSIDEK